MLTAKRHLVIVEALQDRRFLTVHEASALTHASEATTRRDFSELEKNGKIRRIRGGAEVSGSDSVLPLSERQEIMWPEKRVIARKAALYCHENETVMIDGGSTTQAMIGYIGADHLTVITNSFEIARELLSDGSADVHLLGGAVDRSSGIIRGSYQADLLNMYRAETVFIGVGGLNANGATNDDDQLIRVERAMIEQAERVIVLADSSKFRKHGKLFLCGLEEIDIVITDHRITQSDMRLLESSGIDVVVCDD